MYSIIASLNESNYVIAVTHDVLRGRNWFNKSNYVSYNGAAPALRDLTRVPAVVENFSTPHDKKFEFLLKSSLKRLLRKLFKNKKGEIKKDGKLY